MSKPIKVVVVVIVVLVKKKQFGQKNVGPKTKKNGGENCGVRKFGVQIILGTKILGENICL